MSTVAVEHWLPIPEFPGYEVSDLGRIRSFARRTPRVLATWPNADGHLKTRIGGRSVSASYVHQLVLAAFVGPRPAGMICRHLNGDPADNRVENLAWGTQSENLHDSVRHGTHPEASKTSCIRGHEFTAENTHIHAGARLCRNCARDRMREVRSTNVREVNAALRAWAEVNGYQLNPGRIPTAVRDAYALANQQRQDVAA